MISARLERLATALVVLRERDPVVLVSWAAHLKNTSNARPGHWGGRSSPAKRHRTEARLLCRSHRAWRALRPGDAPIAVRLVYVGPRALDDDGLASALKSVRDGVADALGVDDRDERVTWVPDYEYGGVRVYGCRVEVYFV